MQTNKRRHVERLNILVGGPVRDYPAQLDTGQIDGPWIGVDRGAIRLLARGITPEIALGDFDSSKAAEFIEVKRAVADVRQVGSIKDETDTQLGVTVAMTDYDADEIVVYGATGGRLDHLLANLFLPLESRFKTVVERLVMVDRQNTIRWYLPGQHALKKEADKQYLAFVTFGKVTALTLPDERYHLDHANFEQPISFASNEFVGDKASFSFVDGIIAVIQSADLPDNRAERYDLNEHS
ncbi:thiamine diphosphokinase [Furfurilactobacillus siliginis]|uniref:Thiamine diphosphokinase n=1 Tax=Furfurilactobacillus siliginis TaxID=348151 RepID=A0A0R2L655_9LACO|nr:thiamine diphosphokinase [Furfurilactobacillus siliginis]KRN96897.1 thiamine pyrophosphokinase [Furfurilactobacillus siliginis]GEK28093.1 thiamine pyrophosphokinase [Furfurilactobacillus siliginis]